MRVVLTGATGMIGTRVIAALRERGDRPVALSRDAARARDRLGADVEVVTWADPLSTPPPAAALGGADAVIHLLGEPVAQRWTAQARRGITDSRVLGTRNLVAGLRALEPAQRPQVLVSGSATGFYGPRGNEEVPETADPGDDFLAGVVVAWEREARAAEDLCRVVSPRTGVVLAPAGGALDKMLPFFKLGIGGPVAGGNQYVPWIHIDDVVGGLLHAVDTTELSGPANLTAPKPVTNRQLSRALGHALRRPAFWPVPGAAVKLLYGDMATIVITGQRAIPSALAETGYDFRFADVETALRSVVSAS